MKKLILLSFFLGAFLTSNAQPVLSFQKTYGGTLHEYILKTIPTADGGFAFTGYTESSDGDLTVNKGGSDLWVGKANAAGTIEWSKSFGGTADEEGFDLVQLSGGGYIVCGWTDSGDGDVTGHHGTSNSDLWVLRLSANGTLLDNECFGGTSDDEADAIRLASANLMFVAGTSYSTDGDVSGSHGNYNPEVWVIKIDTSLNLLGQKCVGGTEYEEAMDLVVTADGGCAVVGRSYSADGDVTGYHAGSDLLIAKLSSTLSVEWAKCYGGSETEEGNSIVQLADQSYVVLGYTSTHNNGDVTGHHGSQGSDDFWLLKIASNGTLNSAACYGGSGDDQANGLTSCLDGGFTMCGLTNSTDGDVSGFHAAFFEPDIWVAKVNAAGALLWQRCCGGTGQDESFRVYEESNNVYVVCGFTYSADYDVTGWKGDADGWILKVTGSAGFSDNSETSSISFSPNPASSVIYLNDNAVDYLRISDISGATIVERSHPENAFMLPELSSGIYILELGKEGQRSRHQLAIVKH